MRSNLTVVCERAMNILLEKQWTICAFRKGIKQIDKKFFFIKFVVLETWRTSKQAE
jgi:hypothetical protein